MFEEELVFFPKGAAASSILGPLFQKVVESVLREGARERGTLGPLCGREGVPGAGGCWRGDLSIKQVQLWPGDGA